MFVYITLQMLKLIQSRAKGYHFVEILTGGETPTLLECTKTYNWRGAHTFWRELLGGTRCNEDKRASQGGLDWTLERLADTISLAMLYCNIRFRNPSFVE